MPSSTDAGRRPGGPSPATLLAAVAFAGSVGWLLAEHVQESLLDELLLTVAVVSGIGLVRAAVRKSHQASAQAALAAEISRNEQERGELLDHMLAMMDDERASIAHQLHDGPQQVLMAIRLVADAARHALQQADSEAATEAVIRLEQLSGEASDELRRMTGRLHPVVMEQQGLVQALAALATVLTEEYGVKAAFAAPAGPWPADARRDREIYELAREASMSGLLAGARSVRITLICDSGFGLRVQLRGDFSVSVLDTRLLRERANRIDAALELSDEPDGTASVALSGNL